MYLLGVLLMALGIALSIALHEVGHLLPAKRFGVKVTQYMVGFGPTVWSTRRGETEYGLKAVPLGGYVRMIGMFPPRAADGGRLRASSSNPFHQLVEQARSESLEEVQPGEEHRTFFSLPVWKRVIIMMGGPLVNLAIATVLMGALAVGHGVGVLTSTVSAVSPCTPASTTSSDCTGRPPSPALAAGLQVGDRIVAVNGTAVDDWEQASAAIRRSGTEATVTVERAGQRQDLHARLTRRTVPVLDERGAPVKDAQGAPVTEQVSFFGASPTAAWEKQPITAVPGMVGQTALDTARVVLTLPARMVDVTRAAFGSEERDVNGPMSVVGVGRVAGEVADGALGAAAPSLGDKLWILLSLLGSLNMALFVFNMIPLLPLDGGHIAGALWEAVTRGWAHLRHLPDPGPVDTAKALPLAYGVAMALFAMTLLLVYADVVKPISLG